MDISFIIVNWNTRVLLLDCLESIYKTVRHPSFEVWVVDNASEDGSAEAVAAAHPRVNLIENEVNRGFAAANNQALKRMRGRYALLLNSDAALTPGAADELYRFMEENPDAGMACGQLLDPDGSLQNSFAPFPCLSTVMRFQIRDQSFFVIPGRDGKGDIFFSPQVFTLLDRLDPFYGLLTRSLALYSPSTLSITDPGFQTGLDGKCIVCN